MPTKFTKDTNEVLDYKFDFSPLTNGSGDSDYLEAGETISSQTSTATTGLTIDSSSITDTSTSVTVWVSGGTLGTVYSVTCQAVTSLSRTVERTISIRIIDK